MLEPASSNEAPCEKTTCKPPHSVAADLSAATHQGTRLTYDKAGQRNSASTYDQYVDVRERTTSGIPGSEPPETFDVYRLRDGETTEVYYYDGMGRLERVSKDGVTFTRNEYDKASRETVSRQAALATSESDREVQYRTRTTLYDADGFARTPTTVFDGQTESIVTFGTESISDMDGYDAAGILRNRSAACVDEFIEKCQSCPESG